MDEGHLRRFQLVMRIGIALNVLIGLWAWLFPRSLIALFGIPEPDPITFVRYFGIAMILLALFYLPAAIAPMRHRFTALLSTGARALSALFFLFASGFLWLPALYEAVLAALQGWTYWRGWRADLMSKP
jgi:hypothetical protein